MNITEEVCHLLGEASHEIACPQLFFSSGNSLNKGQIKCAFVYLHSKILGAIQLQLNMKELLLQHDDTNKARFLEKASVIFEEKRNRERVENLHSSFGIKSQQ